jgi:hypothetical protein
VELCVQLHSLTSALGGQWSPSRPRPLCTGGKCLDWPQSRCRRLEIRKKLASAENRIWHHPTHTLHGLSYPFSFKYIYCHEYVELKLLSPIRLQGMIRDHKGNCTFTFTHVDFHMPPEQGKQHNEIVPKVWFTDHYVSETLWSSAVITKKLVFNIFNTFTVNIARKIISFRNESLQFHKALSSLSIYIMLPKTVQEGFGEVNEF